MLKLILTFIFVIFRWTGVSAETIKFPENFKWCVATAAHQIEGNNIYSDHYKWEVEKASRVISLRIKDDPSGRESRKNNSTPFASTNYQCPIITLAEDPDPLREHSVLFPSETKDQFYLCEYSGKAVDHWNRVKEDITLLKQLNVNWYRFSIEWAKIEPRKSEFNQEALNHYVSELQLLQAAGIEPHLTLFHFSLPQWLQDEGGWESANAPEYFRKFTERVYQEFAKQGLYISVWYTLNEPMVHLVAGYIQGVLPPGKASLLSVPRVLANMLKGHALAYHELHKLANQLQPKDQQAIRVGVAHHLRVFDALVNNDTSAVEQQLARFATQVIDYLWNWMFVDAIETGRLVFNGNYLKNYFPAILAPWFENLFIEDDILKGTQDFLGLNYYSRDRVKIDFKNLTNPISLVVDPTAIQNSNINDMGWEIYPEGIERILKALDSRVQLYGNRRLSIIISENGIADEKDTKRAQFIQDHLKYTHAALKDGIPIEGYCYWSLTDNFEWNSGYYPQFGLYSVDYSKNMQRLPRTSAKLFSAIAASNIVNF